MIDTQDERLLRVREVAQYLSLTTRSVRDMIARGDLRAYKLGDGHTSEWRVSRSAIVDLLTKGSR